MEFKKPTCTQILTTLILILLIPMSSTVEESISTICVILSFLCSLDIMCHPCLHNSQVPDPAFFASHTDHKSESTAHKSCATEYWIKVKQPLGRSCRTSLGLGAAEISPEHVGIGTGQLSSAVSVPWWGALAKLFPVCSFSLAHPKPISIPMPRSWTGQCNSCTLSL